MNHHYQKVNTSLADYVQTVLVLDGASHTIGSRLPLVTNGVAVLLCAVKNTSHQITLFGQSVPEEKWRVENDETLIAYLFKPFSLAPIFKLPAQTLKEGPVELNCWNAQKAMAVNVQLFHAKTLGEMIEVLDHLILSQIQDNKRECEIIRRATDKIMNNPGADVLPQLLADLNLKERSFQRIFKKYVNIPPSEYRRICQFYFAFLQLKGGHFDKLTDVAYANGYFDQSHYIRSFKEFANITPNEYLQSGLDKK